MAATAARVERGACTHCTRCGSKGCMAGPNAMEAVHEALVFLDRGELELNAAINSKDYAPGEVAAMRAQLEVITDHRAWYKDMPGDGPVWLCSHCTLRGPERLMLFHALGPACSGETRFQRCVRPIIVMGEPTLAPGRPAGVVYCIVCK